MVDTTSFRRVIDDNEFGCDRWPLHYACRIGNIEHVHYLLTIRKVNVNEYDDFQRTPLYFAALTGQEHICELLFANGAKCDESIHDSARIYYVALTSKLRTLLHDWNLSAQAQDPFLETLRQSYNNTTHCDCRITFYLYDSNQLNNDTTTTKHVSSDNNELIYGSKLNHIYVHRIILQVRCPKLADKIIPIPSSSSLICDDDDDNNNNKEPSYTIYLDEQTYPSVAMIPLIEYLYTGLLHNVHSIESAVLLKSIAYELDMLHVHEKIDKAIMQHNNKFSFTSHSNDDNFNPGYQESVNNNTTNMRSTESTGDRIHPSRGNQQPGDSHTHQHDRLMNSRDESTGNLEEERQNPDPTNIDQQGSEIEHDAYENNDFTTNVVSMFEGKYKNNNNKSLFRFEINGIKELKNEMIRIAQVVSIPIDAMKSNDNTTTNENEYASAELAATVSNLEIIIRQSSDMKIKCNDHVWLVHKFRICNQCDYLYNAIYGNFKEATESLLDLSYMTIPSVIEYTLQWFYCDQFLCCINNEEVKYDGDHDDGNKNNNQLDAQGTELSSRDITKCPIDIAVQIIEFGYAILCPRLSVYVANAILSPIVDTSNVIHMIQLARSYQLQRLEDKCVEIIGCNFELLHSSPELLAILIDEVNEIKQGGDINVADIPLAAEIRRAMYKQENGTANVESQVDCLRALVSTAAKQSNSECNKNN